MDSKRKPHEYDLHIGRRIRLRRLELRITQAKLGKALGLTFQQIQKYETGKNRLSGSRIVLMAMALRVDPGYFSEGIAGTAMPPQASDALLQFLASRETQSLFAEFCKLSDLRRKQLLALIRMMASEQDTEMKEAA